MNHIDKLFILILLTTVFGCTEHTTNVVLPSIEQDYGTYDISSYIPLKVGNQWIYEYSTTAERAVLDRRIKDTLRLSSNLLMYGYTEDVSVVTPPANLPIVGYVGHRGGTIYLAGIQGSTIGSNVPVLASPILKGHLWYADIGGRRDSFQIVSVYQGQFKSNPTDTFVVVRRWNQNVVDSICFGRLIGIISQSVLSTDNIIQRQLKSYNFIN